MDGKVKEQKKHQHKHSGPKAERKKLKKQGGSTEEDGQKRNPKAFAFQSAVRMARTFHRAQDIKSKKHHIPLVDRMPLEPPPIVIVVVGPPKVGKSTLIRCLIKNFTRQKLGDICGPVTIVSGKKRRLTFMECNNDINTMIDLAKVADLVLMLIDASFGFEMETFEFLNICQVHGFPRIMGVLTHLDSFKNNKTLRKTKKNLKHRFWTEVYQGAKLFYLSGMVYGEYQTQEVKNLGRFISVMKFRPLVWQTSHPYVLVDRMEDLTDPETVRTDPKCDRTVSLYGYLRGIYLKNKGQVHIPGVGDFQVANVNYLPDPCALPDAQKKRALNEKERLLYAPMAGVGGVVYDKDAVYIDLPANHVNQQQEEVRPTTELVQSLIDTHATLDVKMAASKVSLFSGSASLDPTDIEQQSGEEGPQEKRVWDPNTQRERRAVVFSEEDHKEEEEDDDDDDDDEEDDDDDDDEEEEEGIREVRKDLISDKNQPKKKSSARRHKGPLSNGKMVNGVAHLTNGSHSKVALNGVHAPGGPASEPLLNGHHSDPRADVSGPHHVASDSDSEVYCDSVDQFGQEENPDHNHSLDDLDQEEKHALQPLEAAQGVQEEAQGPPKAIRCGGEDGEPGGTMSQGQKLDSDVSDSSVFRGGQGSRSPCRSSGALMPTHSGGDGGQGRWGGAGTPGVNLNEQIVVALARLQEDMQSVLERLHTLEALSASQARSVALSPTYPSSPVNKRSQKPSWWPFDISPTSLAFAVIWPFVVQWLIRLFLQRRRRRIN